MLHYSLHSPFVYSFGHTETLTKQPPINDLLRQLLSLPIREGLLEPSKVTDYHYSNSVQVTVPLVSNLTQYSSVPILEVHDEVLELKQDTHRSNRKGVSDRFNNIYKQLASSLRKFVDIALLPGCQLSLVQKHGCALHKWAFIDAVCICYG